MISLQLFQLRLEVSAKRRCTFGKFFLQENVNCCTSSSANQRVATVSCLVVTHLERGHNLFTGNRCSQRQSTRQRLRQTHYIRYNTPVFTREKFSCSPETRLNLVED